jgi:hypothetical protein
MTRLGSTNTHPGTMRLWLSWWAMLAACEAGNGTPYAPPISSTSTG